jgi:hypothetical protein
VSEEIAPAEAGAQKSRAELLATAGAAGAEHLAATGGRLAGEEAVATGTHEIAGLERTLHIILEKLTGPKSIRIKPWPPQGGPQNRPGPLWESGP